MPQTQSAATIRRALQCERPRCPCHRGQRVHCPVHDDANPSFGVGERDGKALWKCYSGCDQRTVTEALRVRGLLDSDTSQRPEGRTQRREPDAVYRYVDAEGVVVAEHGRWNDAKGKTFAWRRPDGTWGQGLGDLKTHDLPLYGLPQVLSNPEATVWFVEGEKAANALMSRGLVAVCAAGGASQQMFGNSLDPLAGRDVVLWPDNDDAGVALMERIGRLLPQARMVRPVVPEKGDAYDYFEQGGTVEALRDLVREGQPQAIPVEDDAVTVTYPTPGGVVTFEFTEMSIGRRATDAMCLVRVERRHDEYSSRLNLSSTTARDGVRKDLERMFKGVAEDWVTVVNRACAMAEATMKRQDVSIDLLDVTAVPERQWAVERFAPLASVTVVFGMGGSGKSYLCGDLCIHALLGEVWLGRTVRPVVGVLVIDYEDQPDEWRRRCEQLCKAKGWTMPAGYRYLPGRAIPLVDQAHVVRALVEKYEIGMIIVDSAASAVGGDLKEPAATARLINFLSALGAKYGVTTILIAHNTKSDDRASTMFPYGDIYWHNLPRATHFISTKQADGSPTALVDIWNRKGNRGRQKPIPVRIEFPETDDGPVSIELDEHRTPLDVAHEGAPEDGKQKWVIAALLDEENRPMTVKEISRATGIDEPNARRTLNRHRGELFVQLDGTRPPQWARLVERDDEWAL